MRCWPVSYDVGDGGKYSSNSERISARPVKTFVGGGQTFEGGPGVTEDPATSSMRDEWVVIGAGLYATYGVG